MLYTRFFYIRNWYYEGQNVKNHLVLKTAKLQIIVEHKGEILISPPAIAEVSLHEICYLFLGTVQHLW